MAARYGRVAEVADARGRTIGVRRLRPSEQMRIFEFAVPGDLIPLLCAASVTIISEPSTMEIFGEIFTEWSLHARVTRLGPDGIAAVAHAAWQHVAVEVEGEPPSKFAPYPIVVRFVGDAEPQSGPTKPSPRSTIRDTFVAAEILPRFSKL